MKIFKLGNNGSPWMEHCYPVPVPGPRGPAGPAGPTGPAGAQGVAYGLNTYAGRYNSGESTAILPPGEEACIPLGAAMPARGAGYRTENTITLERAGEYELVFSLSFTAVQAGRFTALVRTGGRELPGTATERTLRAGEHAALSGTVLVALAAGTVLDVALRSPEGAGAVLSPGVNAVLTVKMLNA